MPLHLHLCDRNTPLCEAWERVFADQAQCTIHLGDFFEVEADIMVSGGNSLGLCEVGLELAITLKLGQQLQDGLRQLLLREHDGFLPVGQAVSLPTEDPRWPLLIFAPAMWVPMDVSQTIYPYLAARAAFRLWRGLEGQGGKVWHMLMPGLGTGVGRVPANVCAVQMRRAYEEVLLGRPPRFSSLDAAQEEYRYLVCGGAEQQE